MSSNVSGVPPRAAAPTSQQTSTSFAAAIENAAAKTNMIKAVNKLGPGWKLYWLDTKQGSWRPVTSNSQFAQNSKPALSARDPQNNRYFFTPTWGTNSLSVAKGSSPTGALVVAVFSMGADGSISLRNG